MKEKAAKLLTVKSIVTIVLTLVFAYMAFTKAITAQDFLTIYTVVIAFYFGTQYEKQNQEAGGKDV